MEPTSDAERCKVEVASTRDFRLEIPRVVDELVLTCEREDCFDHVSLEQLPSRDALIDILERARRILYPGYFFRSRVDRMNLGYYFGQEATAFFEILSEQITLAIRHECLRHNLPCTHCQERGEYSAVLFMKDLPSLRKVLALDVRAAYEGDPAAKSTDEIIFSYPGLFAVTVYRIAHQIYQQGIPLIPRIMTEHAHGQTGIDIHPGATIGESFFIDHGTGIVIGETTVIGNRVRIYQGVTLGALSIPRGSTDKLRTTKRHPTIEDDVILYSGATVLGGETTIGARSVIGGNVWITESIPPDSKVFLKRPELIVEANSTRPQTRMKEAGDA